jgi:hypothetical protein
VTVAAALHGDLRALAIVAPLAVVVIGLAIGLLLRRALDVVLEPADPRRLVIADTIMYGGMVLSMGLSLLMHWLRW